MNADEKRGFDLVTRIRELRSELTGEIENLERRLDTLDDISLAVRLARYKGQSDATVWDKGNKADLLFLLGVLEIKWKRVPDGVVIDV